MASTPDPVSVYPDPDPNGEARPPEETLNASTSESDPAVSSVTLAVSDQQLA
jgi:hypothetical protein